MKNKKSASIILIFILIMTTSLCKAEECKMTDGEITGPEGTVALIGTERFCIPHDLSSGFNGRFQGSLIILEYKLTLEGRLGPPAGIDYRGPGTVVSLELLPGGMLQSTEELLNRIMKGAVFLTVQDGFRVYKGFPVDVFIDEKDPGFFFSCFTLPLYEQTSESKYDYCRSQKSYTPSIRLGFTFKPSNIPGVRLLRDDVMNAVSKMHIVR